MRTTIDVLELLRSQHDEVDDLIGQIEDSQDADDKQELFRTLADTLAAHATVEEKLFYPSVMTDETQDMLIEATEEHLSVKRLIADLMDLAGDDPHFDAKLTVLKEQIRHHARQEEEGELFPKVRRMFSADDRAALGNECLAMFESLIDKGDPRLAVPDETREAAQLPVN